MNNQNDEQNRITLSIAFIVVYLTIMFGLFKNVIRPPTIEPNLLNDIVFTFLFVFGFTIIIFFFLSLVFAAVGLDLREKKVIMKKKGVRNLSMNNFLWYN